MKLVHSALLVAAAMACATPAHAIIYNDFVTSSQLSTGLANTATIGFTYAGNKFVGSVYYGTNNNQLYSVNTSGGSLTPFGAPIPGFSGEVYVSASLTIGGYGNRDVYAGCSDVPGTIYRFSNDGTSQSLFLNSGIAGSIRSIGFDPYGLYGNQMVVATGAGNVYTVTNGGVPTLLASLGEDTEGIGFTPQPFGPYPTGTLFTASEGSGAIRAISPSGAVSLVATIPGAEMLAFVPLNLGNSGDPVEGFYAAAYAQNVVKANASEFVPYIGDIIVTDEVGHGVYDVEWDGMSFVTTYLGQFPAQPEDGVFVSLDIIVPEPSSLAILGAGIACLAALRLRKR